MGFVVYDRSKVAELDDRTLAHLQAVIVDKLRRMESFSWILGDEQKEVVMWISPSTPLEFVYVGNRQPALNRAWLEQLALTAGSTEGLMLVPEPADAYA